MRKPHAWSIVTMLLTILAGCSNPFSSTKPTATPLYSVKGGGACVQLGNTPKPPYANIRVSNDALLAHSEPMVVVNPNNPLNLVGGSKFFSDPAHYQFQIGYYASFDGGCTWTDGGIFNGFDKDVITSDISFAFGPDNVIYASVLFDAGDDGSGISVLKSTDGGKAFGAPVTVYEDKTGAIFSDKPWIAVDQTNGPSRGTLYVVWSYDHNEPPCGDAAQVPCTQELGFSKSTDSGKTFSPVQAVESSGTFCTYPADGRPDDSTKCDAVLGATPTILPDGTLAVAYAYVNLGFGDPDRAPGDPDRAPVLGNGISAHAIAEEDDRPTKMIVQTSSDGGETWGAPALAATISDIPGNFPGHAYRNFSLPAFASDPQTGQLYLAWADYDTGDSDILLATSSDQGKTWTTPKRINDDTSGNQAEQFQPQLAVAPNGVVSVCFFDTRNAIDTGFIDTYIAQSIDHGATFQPNIRVTTAAWNPSVGAPLDRAHQQFIGDYQGLAATNSFVYPFWNDTRTGAQDIFTAAIPSAQPNK